MTSCDYLCTTVMEAATQRDDTGRVHAPAVDAPCAAVGPRFDLLRHLTQVHTNYRYDVVFMFVWNTHKNIVIFSSVVVLLLYEAKNLLTTPRTVTIMEQSK